MDAMRWAVVAGVGRGCSYGDELRKRMLGKSDLPEIAGKPFFESKRYDGSGPSKASRVEAADMSCEVSGGPPIS